jgi:hypothetical protein
LGLRILKSAVIGMIGAIGAGTLAIALQAFDAYARPGETFFPLIPERLVFWVVPEGGPAATVLLLLVSATFFWSIFFGMAHFA